MFDIRNGFLFVYEFPKLFLLQSNCVVINSLNKMTHGQGEGTGAKDRTPKSAGPGPDLGPGCWSRVCRGAVAVEASQLHAEN